jgi:hypothetical protein
MGPMSSQCRLYDRGGVIGMGHGYGYRQLPPLCDLIPLTITTVPEFKTTHLQLFGTRRKVIYNTSDMATTTTTAPSQEEVEDFLLSCRYGELEEVQAFVEKFGDEALENARDDRGNSAVHMCCGNGHIGMSVHPLEGSC